MVPQSALDSENLNGLDRPTVMDLQGENHWSHLAEQHWLKPSSKTRKVRPEVIKTKIWDALEQEKFDLRSLRLLENLQFLEKYAHIGHPFYKTLIHAVQLLVARLYGRSI